MLKTSLVITSSTIKLQLEAVNEDNRIPVSEKTVLRLIDTPCEAITLRATTIGRGVISVSAVVKRDVVANLYLRG